MEVSASISKENEMNFQPPFFRRLSIFFRCDCYGFILLLVFLASWAHIGGLFEILLFERPFASEFSWPPFVFDPQTAADYQKTSSDQRRIDYFEFQSSLISSLEEWKLNAALWRAEANSGDQEDFSREFAPGMAPFLAQIPAIRNHIKYLQAVTRRTDLPTPKACLSRSSSAGPHRASLVMLVKSSVGNRARRDAIRQSWASSSLHRNADSKDPHFALQVIFLLGVDPHFAFQSELEKEQSEFGDLVQFDFWDTYYNNTAKLVSGLHFITTACPIVEPRDGFVMFLDDDMLVNVDNLKRLVGTLKGDKEERSADVYLGFMYNSSLPERWMWSKWLVRTSEYPFNRYPPYVTAATVLLSKDTADKFFYASHFLPLYRFDDIYLSILAHVLGILPTGYNHAVRIPSTPLEGNEQLYCDTLISAHGYNDPKLLLETYQRLQQLTSSSCANITW